MKVYFYGITNSMYSYQKLTRHRLCQFVQYESITIFLREMKFFFSLYLSSQKYIFIFLLSLLYILKKQKTVLIVLSLILEILKFLFPFA